MKKLFIALFILFAFSKANYSQDYQPIRKDNVSFFVNNQNEIRANRSDSSKVNALGDSIFYFNRTWTDFFYGYDCIQPNKFTWLGGFAKKKGNLMKFYNYTNSLQIRYADSLHAKWTFYTFENGDVAEAQIVSIIDTTFFGLTDSVKIIEINRKNNSGIIVNSTINGSTLKISKLYGFIETFDFMQFPLQIIPYQLIGMTNPNVGKTYLSEFDIFNFEVGDVFHYKKVNYSYQIYTYNIEQIKTVVEKNYNTNNQIFTYKFDVRQFAHKIDYITNTTSDSLSEFVDNKSFGANPNKIYFPEEPILNSLYVNSFHIKSTSIPNYRCILVPDLERIIKDSDSCWRNEQYDPIYEEKYMEGCGVVKQQEGWETGTIEDLVYYKKGTEMWGTPIVLGIEPAEQNEIQLNPNPVNRNSQVQIRAQQAIENIAVYNTQSLEILNVNNISNFSTTLQTANWQAGIYIVKIMLKNKQIIIKKLIVN